MQQPMQAPVQPQQIQVVIQEPIVKQPVTKPIEKQPVQKPVAKQPVKEQSVDKRLEHGPMQLQCPHCRQWVSVVIMDHF